MTRYGTAAFVITFLTGHHAGRGLAGWNREPMAMKDALAITVIGGLLAGIVHGINHRARAFFAIPFVLGATIYATTLGWFLDGTSSVWSFELLVPVGIAAVPTLIMYAFVLHEVEKQPGRKTPEHPET